MILHRRGWKWRWGDGRGNSPQFLPHPKHSQPSQAHCLLNSCRHRPIPLSFHRRSVGGANQISRGEEIGEGLAASLRAPSLFLSLSCSCFTRALLCTHNYTRSYAYTDAHTHSQIHSHAEDKKGELPWETEAWVKEGCWQ